MTCSPEITAWNTCQGCALCQNRSDADMLSTVNSARCECKASSSLSKFRAKVKELPRTGSCRSLGCWWCANRDCRRKGQPGWHSDSTVLMYTPWSPLVKIPRAVPSVAVTKAPQLWISWWEGSKGCAKGKPRASLVAAFSVEGVWTHLVWKFSWRTPDLSFPDQRIPQLIVAALGTAAGRFVCLGNLENFVWALG